MLSLFQDSVCLCVYVLMRTHLICLNAVLRTLQVLNNTLYQTMHHSIPWIPHPSPLSFLFLTIFSDLPRLSHSLTQNFTYLIRYAWRGLVREGKRGSVTGLPVSRGWRMKEIRGSCEEGKGVCH